MNKTIGTQGFPSSMLTRTIFEFRQSPVEIRRYSSSAAIAEATRMLNSPSSSAISPSTRSSNSTDQRTTFTFVGPFILFVERRTISHSEYKRNARSSGIRSSAVLKAENRITAQPRVWIGGGRYAWQKYDTGVGLSFPPPRHQYFSVPGRLQHQQSSAGFVEPQESPIGCGAVSGTAHQGCVEVQARWRREARNEGGDSLSFRKAGRSAAIAPADWVVRACGSRPVAINCVHEQS